MMFGLTVLTLSFLTCAVTLSLLIKRVSRLPVDLPNDRSLHQVPTPRIGGLGILAGLAVSCVLLRAQWLLELALPSIGLAAVSLMDDYFSLSARVRLFMHVIAVIAFLTLAGLSGLATSIIVFFSLVWMTNLYNFMDGADGLAGGMALFGFGAYGLAAWLGGSPDLALICWAVSAAALGFLLFNFPPARVFMGDAGSIPLGFLAGALGALGWQQRIWPAWFPVLVFSPFIADATVTLIRRGMRGEKIWQAHKSHYYQRLVRLGLSHRQLALSEYALMIAVAASAVWISSNQPDQAMPLLASWALVYLLIGLSIDWRWRRKHGHAL